MNSTTLNIIREDIQRVKAEIKELNARAKKARRRGDLKAVIDCNTQCYFCIVDLLDELEELGYALVDAETANTETANTETANTETATEETTETATEETTETATETTETETTETEINVAIETIAELTQWNFHSQAVVVLAVSFGTEQQITEARRIKELHEERGCMSRELLTRRDLVSAKIMSSIAKKDLDLFERVGKAF